MCRRHKPCYKRETQWQMRSANGWADYEVIDTSNGMKLERWGDIILIRPDPQIIWKTPKINPLWKNPHAIYHRSSKGGGQWEYKKKLPESWVISYGDLKYKVSPTGFKHTGLFPEQAVNWDFLINRIKSSKKKLSFLNLFGYTGGATVACASAGASVCHVDASKGMVAWAKENANLSGLSQNPIRYIVDDCKKFVEREIRRGNKYDGIIMDPPSYGRGPGGEIWKLEDSVFDLVNLCKDVLSDEPECFILNSYTTGLPPSVMQYVLWSTVGRRFGGSISSGEIGLPVRESGQVLPCGNTAIWTK